nr:MAG TPA: hypothetical protein [Caudoviricetes sp.]DAU12799.1 MAG TPA: hypothetical protein [Caudoviricetes sp.]DAY14260.1 MAG TPA: hypothetical protein [Caudoviricetes sp.]
MLSHFYQPPFCNKKRAAFTLLYSLTFSSSKLLLKSIYLHLLSFPRW